MALWFVRSNPAGYKKVDRINLSAVPCPTICAGGVYGDSRSHYYLEEDGNPDPMPEITSPPYRVPSMAEIEALPKNGFSVISLFSGCGGSSLGYKMAGYSVLWANEFIPAARETYALNHKGTLLDGRDIREIKPEEILAATGKAKGELDLLDGSPPCASFSTAGKREKTWGKVKKYSDGAQRTDDLFFEYARLVAGIAPKVFVAENVSGLVKGTAKGYFLEILSALKACGYRVEARLLDAQWLGVPQARQRMIFVGVREDLGVGPAFPKPLPYRYSVKEACPWIASVRRHSDDRISWNPSDKTPSPTITADGHRTSPTAYKESGGYVEAETDISRYAIGKLWDEIKPGEQHPKRFSLVKPSLYAPCPTIQCGASAYKPESRADVCHPTEKRKFSIAELKRICAFPDDFILTGSYAQQWERLGRAVPPVMMEKIASAILEGVLCKL